jgi:hypothetical protein
MYCRIQTQQVSVLYFDSLYLALRTEYVSLKRGRTAPYPNTINLILLDLENNE